MKKALFFLIAIASITSQSFAQTQGKSKIDSLLSVLKKAKDNTAKVNTLNTLANEFRTNNPDTAIYFAGEAQALAVKINDKMGLAKSFVITGTAISNLGNYERGIKNINDALNIYDQLLPLAIGTDKTAEKLEILQAKGRALNNIGLIYWHQGNYPEALKKYFISLKIREETGNKKEISYSYNNIGLVYWDQGNYSEALKNYFISLKISEEIGDIEGIAYSYTNIGLIYNDQGNYPEALKNYFASLKIAEKIGDKNLIASTYINIGIIYANHSNYPEALRNYFTALKIMEEIGNKNGIARTKDNIGSVYYDQGNYPQALTNHLAALKIMEEIRDKEGIADSYHAIGFIFNALGNYPEALKNYFAALKIREEIGDKSGLAKTYRNVGILFTKQKIYNEASHYLNNGLSLAKNIGSLADIQDSYFGLAELDSAQGNCKKSLEHYKMYIITRDSIYNQEKTKKIMQIEVDKKDALAKAEQENKDALALKELQKQKLVRNGFIGGFAVVLLFAGVFFRQRIRISKEKRKSEEERIRAEAEKNRSEELLLNILPYEVAEELKSTGSAKAKTFSMVSVMFTDFKDFTSVSEKVSAELLVDEIHYCFSAFDNILQKYKIEKIKTIGDSYMCASGLPVLNYTHAVDIVNAAFEIRDFMATRKKEKESRREIPFELRIGIHTGPVVAGIVGVKKFQYDIWGDTVNIASRMESSGEAGKVNISGNTYQLVKDQFTCTYRGKVQAKNKGEIDMYFVESLS